MFKFLDWVIAKMPEFVAALFYGVAGLLASENLLFTNVEEGQIKIIVNRGGDFVRAVMAFDGYHLNNPALKNTAGASRYQDDKNAWEVLPNGLEPAEVFETGVSAFEKKLGVRWVGWPWRNRVYIYTFRFNETIPDPATGESRLRARTVKTDFIFAKDFTYGIATVGAETSEGVPTDEETAVTVACTNPYRALFAIDDWIRLVTAEINRIARELVAGKTYKELLKLQDTDKAGYGTKIVSLSEALPTDSASADAKDKGLAGRYGITIRSANLEKIDLSGAHKDRYQDAAGAEFVAEMEGNAKRKTAAAQADATIATGTAEAEVIGLKGAKEAEALASRLAVITSDPNGVALVYADALVQASQGKGTTTIWANDPINVAAVKLAASSTGSGGPTT